MQAVEARRLFQAAGLTETVGGMGKARVLGEYYQAVWTKSAA